ncbi:MAG TPA: PhzF family phenazine biosynthesis protein [Vicinamibacterales bacterium]|nr:PhzF family phenazine biosynthesis protein [Vicinamibacterales bacterium]
MPRSYRYLHLDVFTASRFGGNQLAVFLDGRGLTADLMQAIAKEMNFSESTFILPRETPDTDMRVRIFTPGAELPIAGHPTIGTAFALSHVGAVSPGESRVVFGLGVGPTPVELAWAADRLSFAWMTQPLPTFSPAVEARALAAAALGLPGAAVEGAGLPVQIVSCGVPYLMIPLATRAQVDRAVVDAAASEQLARAAGLGDAAFYVFTLEQGGTDEATVYSRMFGPALGIPEDPATGSAAGPLGCYLFEHRVLDAAKAATIVNLQGVRMGRPSVIHVAIASDAGTITRVRVGGEAVLAGEGTLYV